jgi:hypothetical protein
MSAGAVKGIEVLLIAGGLFWFAYAQMKALKKPSPGAEKPETDHASEAAPPGTDDAGIRDKS